MRGSEQTVMTESAPLLTGEPESAVKPLSLAGQAGFYERRLKRPFDIVVTILLVVVLAPIAVAIARAVRVGLGQGVLYSQRRVGRHGHPFTIWKFRTMRHDRRNGESRPIPGDRRQVHKTEHDPRHTGLGTFLRRLSLDEIPQLWNVIRGDMSLVGPRPEVYEVAEKRGYIDHVRHEVRPGMTGPFQISEVRATGDLRDGLEGDVEYVRNVTLRGDLGLLVKTLIVTVRRSAAGS